MALTDSQRSIVKLYIAAFRRPPEKSGFDYWTGELARGRTMADITSSVFSLDSVKALYPASMPNDDFVRAIYTNVLGKSPDADGLKYWLGVAESLPSRGELVMRVIDAALATPDSTPGKAFLVNQMALSDYAVAQQAKYGVEISSSRLGDINKMLKDDTASLGSAIAAVYQSLASAPGHVPTAPSELTVHARGAGVFANTVTRFNTGLVASATIALGEAVGGKALLMLGDTVLATDNTILAGDTQVTFDLGTTTNADLQARLPTGGVIKVVLADAAGKSSASTINPTLTVNYTDVPAPSILFDETKRTLSISSPSPDFSISSLAKPGVTDIKASLDWSKFYWDIDSNNRSAPGASDVRLTLADIASVTLGAVFGMVMTVTLSSTGMAKVQAARAANLNDAGLDSIGILPGFFPNTNTDNSAVKMFSSLSWAAAIADFRTPVSKHVESGYLDVTDASIGFNAQLTTLVGGYGEDALTLYASKAVTLDLTRGSAATFNEWESIWLQSPQNYNITFGAYPLLSGVGRVTVISYSTDAGKSAVIDASRVTVNSMSLTGGAGNDSLTGSAQDDILGGGSGNDTIDLRAGGADTIGFTGNYGSYLDGGVRKQYANVDTVIGFKPGAEAGADKMSFGAFSVLIPVYSNTFGFQSYAGGGRTDIMILNDGALGDRASLEALLRADAAWRGPQKNHIVVWDIDLARVGVAYTSYGQTDGFANDLRVWQVAELTGLPNQNAEAFMVQLVASNFSAAINYL